MPNRRDTLSSTTLRAREGLRDGQLRPQIGADGGVAAHLRVGSMDRSGPTCNVSTAGSAAWHLLRFFGFGKHSVALPRNWRED